MTPTLTELIARHLEAAQARGRRHGVRTLIGHERILSRHFGADFPAAKLTAAAVDRFVLARRGEGVSDATIASNLRALRAVLRRGVREGLLLIMPCEPDLRADPKEMVLPPVDALRRAIATAPTHLRGLLRFTAATGLRSGEVRSLTWDVIDFAAGTVTLRANPAAGHEGPKGRRERVVPLSEPALAVLREQRELTPAEIVFPTVRGTYWSTERLSRAVKAHMVRAGAWVAGAKPTHQLRAFFVTTCLRSGAHPTEVQQLVGHRQVTTTLRYAVPDATAQRAAAARVAASLGIGEAVAEGA